MPRLARVVAVGLPHHITQRGNYRQDVFRDDGDRATYLGLISEYCKPAQLGLIGYCLMTNHVHLIAVPEREDSLARAADLGGGSAWSPRSGRLTLPPGAGKRDTRTRCASRGQRGWRRAGAGGRRSDARRRSPAGALILLWFPSGNRSIIVVLSAESRTPRVPRTWLVRQSRFPCRNDKSAVRLSGIQHQVHFRLLPRSNSSFLARSLWDRPS